MTVSRNEIEERWFGFGIRDDQVATVLDSFTRVEQLLGRPWLEASLAAGLIGPAVALPIYAIGVQLQVITGAKGADKLIQRLRAREPSAFSELHSIALCVGSNDVELEIEPRAKVGDAEKVPDFRLRYTGEDWVWVEVTQPDYSQSARIAQEAAASLRDLFDKIPDGVEFQIRFRCEPSEADLDAVRRQVDHATLDQTIETPNFIIHSKAATGSLTPTGSDEHERPIFGNALQRVTGDRRALLSVRVPYSDLRGQKVIDSEARQLPKEGRGLICIATFHGKYWQGLIERSFSPNIRRRISAVLLYQTGLVPGEHGLELQTVGRVLINPHARMPLPSRLEVGLRTLPAAFRTA